MLCVMVSVMCCAARHRRCAMLCVIGREMKALQNKREKQRERERENRAFPAGALGRRVSPFAAHTPVEATSQATSQATSEATSRATSEATSRYPTVSPSCLPPQSDHLYECQGNGTGVTEQVWVARGSFMCDTFDLLSCMTCFHV